MDPSNITYFIVCPGIMVFIAPSSSFIFPITTVDGKTLA